MLSDANDEKDDQGSKTGNIGSLGEEKVKSTIKIRKHIEIAETHIKDSDGDSDGKVSRRDKAVNLQDPAKHASEERLLYFLLDQYTLGSDVTEKVDILKNLENFAHKSENGRDLFKSTNALQDILIPALNSSEAEIRKGSCGVLAIAAQNNPYVQHKVWESGVLRLLIHILNFDQHVRPKALFALSSLLRLFPEAQQKFVLEGGSAALVKVAFLSETRKRALTLISDLLIERKHCVVDEEDFSKHPSKTRSEDRDHIDNILSAKDPCDKEKLLQTSLLVNGWCDVLKETLDNFPGFDQDDQVLILEAVSNSLSFCQNLNVFEQTFQKLLLNFEPDEIYEDVVIVLKNILSAISNHEQPTKDEL